MLYSYACVEGPLEVKVMLEWRVLPALPNNAFLRVVVCVGPSCDLQGVRCRAHWVMDMMPSPHEMGARSTCLIRVPLLGALILFGWAGHVEICGATARLLIRASADCAIKLHVLCLEGSKHRKLGQEMYIVDILYILLFSTCEPVP